MGRDSINVTTVSNGSRKSHCAQQHNGDAVQSGPGDCDQHRLKFVEIDAMPSSFVIYFLLISSKDGSWGNR
ncbi:hypothetical protein ACVJBD_006962 [Rhizobium mongolense]